MSAAGLAHGARLRSGELALGARAPWRVDLPPTLPDRLAARRLRALAAAEAAWLRDRPKA